MMRTLTALSLTAVLAAASSARAEDSFESRAAGARRLPRLDDLVWAFTATCDAGDDVQQRQCRRLRDARAATLAGATLIVDADRAAFSVGAWSPQKRSAPITLTGCIRCGGVELDGKTWYVTGSVDGSPAPRFVGGKLDTGLVYDNARTFPDEASARKFAASASAVKLQLLVKVPARPAWTADGRSGLALEVLGFRAFSPCDGSVVFSNPAAGPVEVDKRACGELVAGAGEVEALTPALVSAALAPAFVEVKACHARLGVAGKATVRFVIGGDGAVLEYEQEGELVGTPTGQCIDAAMKGITFPRSKKPRTPFVLPVVLPSP